MKEKFRVLANRISTWAGSAAVFIGAIFIIIIWAAAGPATNFSNTWQLIINTGTTIITFLMVFLIQNTQNRDSKAMQLKLDELIRAQKTARDSFVSLEDISDEELLQITEEFKKLHEDSRTPAAMHKLHQKIEAEKAKRQTLRSAAKSAAGKVVSTLLTPLNVISKDVIGKDKK